MLRSMIRKVKGGGNSSSSFSTSSSVSFGPPSSHEDNLQKNLPRDVLFYVLGMFTAEELAAVAHLSRFWRNISKEDRLWKPFCEGVSEEEKSATSSGWRDYFVELHRCCFELCGEDLIISKDKRVISIVERGVPYHGEMAVGKIHKDGVHKYTVEMEMIGYAGVGVCGGDIESFRGPSVLHEKPHCSIYYYTAVWYGGEMVQKGTMEGLVTGDKLDVYFEVATEKVIYLRNGRLLLSCKCKSEGIPKIKSFKKGLRFTAVLGNSKTKVKLVNYQRLRAMPDEQKFINA